MPDQQRPSPPGTAEPVPCQRARETSGGGGRATSGGHGAQAPTQPARPVTLARRFGALVVDWVLCTLAAGLIGPPHQYPWGPSLILLLEYGFFLGLFGQTPGMYLARIRCVSLDGGVIGIPRALLRAALVVLVVPALIMTAGRRGLHDRAAGSVMVAAG